MEPISKLFAVFLIISLMIMYPLYQAAERHDDQMQTVVHLTVTEFVDAVRTKGYISPQMYLEFNEKLGATGNLYDVKMEHRHKNIIRFMRILLILQPFKTVLIHTTRAFIPMI